MLVQHSGYERLAKLRQELSEAKDKEKELGGDLGRHLVIYKALMLLPTDRPLTGDLWRQVWAIAEAEAEQAAAEREAVKHRVAEIIVEIQREAARLEHRKRTSHVREIQSPQKRVTGWIVTISAVLAWLLLWFLD